MAHRKQIRKLTFRTLALRRLTKERLQQDENLAERTKMSVTNVMKLLDFVLNINYFKHDGHHYKQVFGCAMGSPIRPVLEDLAMEVIEEIAITTALHPPPNGGFVMLTTAIRA